MDGLSNTCTKENCKCCFEIDLQLPLSPVVLKPPHQIILYCWTSEDLYIPSVVSKIHVTLYALVERWHQGWRQTLTLQKFYILSLRVQDVSRYMFYGKFPCPHTRNITLPLSTIVTWFHLLHCLSKTYFEAKPSIKHSSWIKIVII